MSNLEALSVRLAELSGGRISAIKVDNTRISMVLDVSGFGPDQRDALEAAIKDALPEFADVRIAMTAERRVIPIIAVASGKGGVGKSTLSANLAIALAKKGRRVGLVDADIYGPSQPVLMGTAGKKAQAREKTLIPLSSPFGLKMLSIGHIVDPDKALAWRGPMATGALTQLLEADWTGCDLLIVDLPPGTGDIQLSMIQKHKPAGAIIVSTPQDLALIDAARAVSLFGQVQVPIIGVVENMSGYICPHCGEGSDPFGTGGAEAEAAKIGAPFLGRIPLSIAIRQASDAGTGAEAGAFDEIAAKVEAWLAERKA